MNAERILKAVIKLAAVCLTAPATLAVASTLYADWGLWRWVTAGAALVLVEGALLLGWQLLDSQGKTATEGQRTLYAALVVVAYCVLWAIALAHGEGLAGIAFRATLGVLIAYSLAEAGIMAGLRQDRAILQDATRDRKVRRHQKRLAVRDAIAALDMEYILRDKERVNVMQEQTARLDNQHRAAMSTIKQGRDAIIEGFPFPVEQARGIRDNKRATRKQRALDMILAARKAKPDMTQNELAALAGVSRQTIGSWLAELEQDGTGNNGNGNGAR